MTARPASGYAGAAWPGWPRVVLAASLLAACSAARSGQGTTDESCYLALPDGGEGGRRATATWTACASSP